MRTLLVTVEYPPDKGGISTYIKNEVDELRAAGIDVWVAALPLSGDDADTTVSVYASQKLRDQMESKKKELDEIKRDKKLLRIPFYYKIFRPRWLRLFFTLYKDVKKDSYDYLISHHVLPVGQAMWLLKKVKKVPYILHIHGLDVMLARKSKWKRWWLKRIIWDAEFVVANSKFAQSAFDGFKAKKTVIAYPCPNRHLDGKKVSDDTLYNMRKQYVLGERKVLLSVARLVERKGLQAVAEAMPAVLEADPGIVWCIVGVGDYADQLGKIVAKHDLHYATRFIGAVDWESLKAWYSMADVFAMPSIQIGADVEGWGIVYSEAALYSIPVVAGKAGGSPEAVVDKQTGFVVDGNDSKAVGRAITNLFKDKELAQKMGAAGRKRILEEFQWKVQIGEVIKAINELQK